MPARPTTRRLPAIARLLVVALLAAPLAWAPAAQPLSAAQNHRLFLPLVARPGGCPTVSSQQFSAGPVAQWDTDNPVRPAYAHADKNIDLRGYAHNPSAHLGLVQLGSDDPTTPPQLATLFNPTRLPAFTAGYRVHHWQWAASPQPGTRQGVNTDWAVTVLGMGTAAGETLRVPASGYDIGGIPPMEVIVLFADADSVTFKYTREDSVMPNGYTLHVDNICTDPNLLSLYNAHDAPGGPRYQPYPGTPNMGMDYNLPNLASGQPFGWARGGEVRVAIVDSGAWMDPRSCDEFWQVRPNASC